MNFAIWPIASPIQSLLTYFIFFFWGFPRFVFLLFLFSSLSPSPSPTTHSESALNGDRLAHASLMTKSLGLWPSPHRWPQTSGTPLGEPHVCSPAWAARAEMWAGEWRCLSPGGSKGRFLPTRSLSEPCLGPGLGTPPKPLPALWDRPVATHRHLQALVPRPKESSTQGQLPWQPRGSFHSPPSRSPLLPALQPTGLCASGERTIKPAGGAGEGRRSGDLREVSSANPQRGKPRFANAGGKSLSMQSVQSMSLSLPTQCLCLAFLLLHLLGQVSGAPFRCPRLLCRPGRPLLGHSALLILRRGFSFFSRRPPGGYDSTLPKPVPGPVPPDAADLRARGESGAGRLLVLSGVCPPARRQLLGAGALRGEPRPLL